MSLFDGIRSRIVETPDLNVGILEKKATIRRHPRIGRSC